MLVPLDRKPDWKNPPTVTLLLILANVLCFYLWQINDEQHRHDADNYYFSSDLPEIELPRYRDYLLAGNASAFPELVDYLINDDVPVSFLHQYMEYDGSFMQHVRKRDIVAPADAQYDIWLSQRNEYEKLRNQIVAYHFALVNIQPDITSLFTSMFLHGGFAHLFWNMVFLLLVGFIVEMALGRLLYLFSYLLAGLMSGLFWILLEPTSGIPGIGASGAISGLMGMYTVLFGARKIRFFLLLPFYFDYVKAPAIVLLPVWLAYELYDQLLLSDNVNNLAHIGGLLSGALIAWLAKKYSNSINMDYLDEAEKQQAFKLKYQAGTRALASMDVGKAQRLFSELSEENPDHVELMQQLYNVVKLAPGKPEIHQQARRILSLTDAGKTTIRLQHGIFVDYVTRVQPNVKLGPELMLSLALRFAANDYLEDAEKIVLHLTTRLAENPRNAEGLMALVTHFHRTNNHSKSQKYLAMLLEFYPNSEEANNARRAFDPQVLAPETRD